MRPLPVALALSMLLLALAAPAQAHAGHEYDVVEASNGKARGYLSVEALVLKAQREANFTLGLLDEPSYAPSQARPVLRALLGDQSVDIAADPAEGGLWLGRMRLPEPGAWTLEADLGEAGVLAFPLQAYPDHGYVLASAEARYGIHPPGRALRIPFQVLDDAENPRPAPAGARALVDAWDPANRTEPAREVPLRVAEGNVLLLETTFPEAGHYRVRFVLPGVSEDDLPSFRVRVQAGLEPFNEEKETPAPGLAALVGALAGAGALRGLRARFTCGG